MKLEPLVDQRIKFWALVWLIISGPLFLYLYLTHSKQKCLRTQTSTTMETYYDFSESGMGIWQEPVSKTICVEYENLPK